MIKKPMLAGTMKNEALLKFPVLASPKLDGFRCLKLDGKCLTRSFKPLGNNFVREWIEANVPDGMDGELMLADPKATFGEISSALRRPRRSGSDRLACAGGYTALARIGPAAPCRL